MLRRNHRISLTRTRFEAPNVISVEGQAILQSTSDTLTLTCGTFSVLVPVQHQDSVSRRGRIMLLSKTPVAPFQARLQLPPLHSGDAHCVLHLRTHHGKDLETQAFTVSAPTLKAKGLESLHVSQTQLLDNGTALDITGWLEDPDNVSRIEVHAGPHKRLAQMHKQRPDTLQQTSHLRTAHCGFHARVPFMEAGGRVELRAFDHTDAPLCTQALYPKEQDIFVLRDATAKDAVVASYDAETGLLSIYVALVGQGLPTRMHLRGAEGISLSTTAITAHGGKASKAFSSNGTTWIAMALFALPEFPTTPLELLVEDMQGAVRVPSVTSRIVSNTQQPKITSAHYCPQNHTLIVTGDCGFLGVSHVHAVVDGRIVAASRTFLQNHSDFQNNPGSAFYLACLLDIPQNKHVQIEYFAGEQKLYTCSANIHERVFNPQILGPSVRSSQGGIHYELPSAQNRPDAPWIVYATGMTSWPITGGGMARSYAMAKHLRDNGYRVALVVELPAEEGDQSAKNLQDYADAVIFVPKYTIIPQTTPDFGLNRKVNPNLGPLLETLEVCYEPAATMVNFAFNLYATERLSGPVILDAHDVQHLRARNAQQHGSELEDRRCTRHEEEMLLQQADGIIAIQSEEQRILQDCAPQKQVVTAEHTLEVHPNSQIPTADQLKQLLFIGQRYTPNIEGLRAFLNQVWPQLKARHPDIHLHIVGRVCEVFRDLQDPQVTCHGVVPHLEPLYAQCGIVINPTNFGTGFKIKSLEGLAYKRCVVTTPAGALGFPSDAPLCVCDLSQFAPTISALITDPETAQAQAQQAATFLKTHFSPSFVYRHVIDMLAQLPAAPKADTRIPTIVHHEVKGSDLVLSLRFDDVSHAPRSLKIQVQTIVGQPTEIWHAAPASLTDGKFKIPLPVWLFDGSVSQAQICINGQSAGTLDLHCVQDKAEAYLMPNWYFQGLGAQAGTRIIAPKTRQITRNSDLRTYLAFSRNRFAGYAIGRAQNSEMADATWAKSLLYLPSTLPAHTTETLSLYDSNGKTAGAVLPAHDVRQAAPVTVHRPATTGSAPEGVWNAQWPVQIAQQPLSVCTGDRHPDSHWHATDGLVELRLDALLKSTYAFDNLDLSFPPGSEEDEVFRWHVLVNGIPALMHRRVETVETLPTLRTALEHNRAPGVHLATLIYVYPGGRQAQSTPILPTSLTFRKH